MRFIHPFDVFDECSIRYSNPEGTLFYKNFDAKKGETYRGIFTLFFTASQSLDSDPVSYQKGNLWDVLRTNHLFLQNINSNSLMLKLKHQEIFKREGNC